MSDVTVAVATYGDPSWLALAGARAIPSARAQGVPVVSVHADSLHAARNACLDQVQTERVILLDADDELEPGYINAMAVGTADVRAPRVRYVRPGGAASPAVMLRVSGHDHPQCCGDCLAWGNWVVIGAMVRTDLLRKVGGFEPWPLYEDWAAMARMWQAGATFEPIPRAIYRAHVRRDSRNRAPGRAARLAAHRAIAEALGLPVPP
jgi:hypothetical protein